MKLFTLFGAAVAVLLLAQLPSHSGELKELTLVGGMLTHGVPLTKSDAKVDGKPAKVYAVKLSKGKTYQIDLTITKKKGGGDPYLVLQDAAGKELARDDDGGGFPNARITFTCPEDAAYRVVCTSFIGNQGVFTLRIQEKK